MCTPRDGTDPSGGADWQAAMIASLEQAGEEHANSTHVPTGFKLRNTFLEPDDGESDSSGGESMPESMSSRSVMSHRSLTMPSSPKPPAPAQPPGSWAQPSGSGDSAWDQLMAEVARSQDGDGGESTKRVRPTKPRRMKGKQLAETLFDARNLSVDGREQAAIAFMRETTGEDALRAYACTVLRRLIEDSTSR